MPAIRDDASAALTQRGIGLSALGIVLVSAAAWRLLGVAQPVTLLGGGASPVAGLSAYAVADNSPVSRPDLLPGQTMVLQRDPFTATVVSHAVRAAAPDRPAVLEAANHKWQVTAVLITRSRRAAVIDDSLVEEGGILAGGARLTSVQPDRVVVTDASGMRHTLTARDGGEGL